MTKKDKLIYARYLKMSYEDAFAEGFAEGFAKGFAEGFAEGLAEDSERIIRIIREADIPEGVKESILTELSECLTIPSKRDDYTVYNEESQTHVCKVF